ncbi:hypothetical protein [Spirilliplanes yamanashiensis]|nr:hypothetical protein [Spirilliplanes yamanashiensis]MDP9818755.1 phage-related tail protein [Spirilliplanes yamanashiensis]
MPAEPTLTGLARLRARRAQLDAEELELLTAARAAGATWAQIAAALGVATRQAAEQRHARLLRATRHHDGDTPPVTELRAAAAGLRAALAGTGPALTLATLDAAATAPPGALYSLAAHVAADLTAADLTAAPAATRSAAARFTAAALTR